jgi:hypothetical protein
MAAERRRDCNGNSNSVGRGYRGLTSETTRIRQPQEQIALLKATATLKSEGAVQFTKHWPYPRSSGLSAASASNAVAVEVEVVAAFCGSSALCTLHSTIQTQCTRSA